MTNHISRNRSVPFPEGYGIFPYLIVKRGYALYQQLPIQLQHGGKSYIPGQLVVGLPPEEHRTYVDLLFDDDFRHTLLELAQHVFASVNKPCCLVFGPKDAVYFTEDGPLPHQSIPSGGTLLNAKGKPIQFSVPHHLEAYDDLG